MTTGWACRPPAVRARRVVATALFACAPALTGCWDGYPTEDVVQPDPARMSPSPSQLLAALNELGSAPRLGERWRYRLHPPCELEVLMRGDDAARRLALDGATVASSTVDGVSRILLLPATRDEDQGVTVLETFRWSDTVRARALLTQLNLRCSGATAAGPR